MKKRIKVVHVNEASEPYSPQGKNYTVYKWKCDIEVDGHLLENVLVETLSGKAAEQVRDGWEGECESREYNGVTSWKVPTPENTGGYGGGRGGGGGRQRASYTLEEYDKLYKAGYDRANSLVSKREGMSEDERGKMVSSMMATWVIGARDCGIKM